jgi:hypothetical protein
MLTKSQRQLVQEHLERYMFRLYEYSKIRKRPIIEVEFGGETFTPGSKRTNFWLELNKMLGVRSGNERREMLYGEIFITPLVKIEFKGRYPDDISNLTEVVIESNE